VPGALRVDNLRVYSGPLAVAQSYPTCAGSGGAGRPPVETKICRIKHIKLDVMATGCTQPESLIDVVGWLSYWFCWLGKYFSWLPENTAQAIALQDRQANVEPVGTILELNNVVEMFTWLFQDIYGTWTVGQYYNIDWSLLLDFSRLDDIPAEIQSNYENLQPVNFAALRARCPAFLGHGGSFETYACYAVVTARDMPQFGLLQWTITVVPILALIAEFVRRISVISKLGGGGAEATEAT